MRKILLSMLGGVSKQSYDIILQDRHDIYERLDKSISQKKDLIRQKAELEDRVFRLSKEVDALRDRPKFASNIADAYQGIHEAIDKLSESQEHLRAVHTDDKYCKMCLQYFDGMTDYEVYCSKEC